MDCQDALQEEFEGEGRVEDGPKFQIESSSPI